MSKARKAKKPVSASLDNFSEKSSSLYSDLGIASDANQDQIKSSYRRLALQFHPDKLATKTDQERHEATIKFQKFSQAYAILSDAKSRKIYDETGEYSTSGGLSPPDDMSDYEAWEEFYKEVWAGLVTKERIQEFKKEYQGSQEEKQDIINSYLLSKGSLDKIFEDVMLSDPIVDEARFTEILESAIKLNQIPRYPAFKRDVKATARRKKEAEKEAKLAENELKRLEKESGQRVASEDDLKQLIASRGKIRMDDLVSRLEEKYGGKGNKSANNNRNTNITNGRSSGGMVGKIHGNKSGKITISQRSKQDDDEVELGDEDSEMEDEDEEDWEDEEGVAEGEEEDEQTVEDNDNDEESSTEDEDNEVESAAEEEGNEEDELDEEPAVANISEASDSQGDVKGPARAKRKVEEIDELDEEDDFVIDEIESTQEVEQPAKRSEPSEAEFLAIRARIEAERTAKVGATAKSNGIKKRKV